ncbi:unnamed protein product, partial [Symbiodinium natans]
PMASLQPSEMTDAEWSALFAATQPRGELPTCRLPKVLTMRIMDMICLAVKEEPDIIRAWAARMVEALGETFRQIHCFHVQGACNL